MGCGIEPRKIRYRRGREFYSLEGNRCGPAMRGADALPGSKATSRAKGSYRNLGALVSGRRCRVQSPAVRIGKARMTNNTECVAVIALQFPNSPSLLAIARPTTQAIKSREIDEK